MSETKEQGELKLIKFADKILTVYRRCSCGGDVEIEKDPATGENSARCLACGVHIEWGGEDKKEST